MPFGLPSLPPKSGCTDTPPPMKLMKLALFESRGAALTSTFHQLSGGKSGSGVGSGAGGWGACAEATAGPSVKANATRVSPTRCDQTRPAKSMVFIRLRLRVEYVGPVSGP